MYKKRANHRIEGGLTRTAFDTSLRAFKAELGEAVKKYVSSGGGGDFAPDSEIPFARLGLSIDYSMQCSTRVEYKSVLH